MGEVRHAEVNWSGDLQTGAGVIKYVTSGVFSRLPVSWASRTSAHNGKTSPEELLAAAHASCFSMAFSARLGEERHAAAGPERPRRGRLRPGRRRLEGHHVDAHGLVPSSRASTTRRSSGSPRTRATTARSRRPSSGTSSSPSMPSSSTLLPRTPSRSRCRSASPSTSRRPRLFTRWGGFVYRRRRWLALLAVRHGGRLRGARAGHGRQPDHGRLARPELRIRPGRGPAGGGLRRRSIRLHHPVPLDRAGRRRHLAGLPAGDHRHAGARPRHRRRHQHHRLRGDAR